MILGKRVDFLAHPINLPRQKRLPDEVSFTPEADIVSGCGLMVANGPKWPVERHRVSAIIH
jgi:hypothetical protein